MPSVIQIERVQTVHAILNSDQAVKISIAGVYISPPNPWNLKTANFMISRPVYDRQPESQGPTELGIVGSGSYEQSWRAIPTHRYGGPGNSYPVQRASNPEWHRSTSGNSSGVLANSKYGLEPTTAEANAIQRPLASYTSGLQWTKVTLNSISGPEIAHQWPNIRVSGTEISPRMSSRAPSSGSHIPSLQAYRPGSPPAYLRGSCSESNRIHERSLHWTNRHTRVPAISRTNNTAGPYIAHT